MTTYTQNTVKDKFNYDVQSIELAFKHSIPRCKK